jgi:hypothetical protein
MLLLDTADLPAEARRTPVPRRAAAAEWPHGYPLEEGSSRVTVRRHR